MNLVCKVLRLAEFLYIFFVVVSHEIGSLGADGELISVPFCRTWWLSLPR